MAWVDDRIWCHPKFTDLRADAFKLYVCGVAYSTGFGTGGHLSPGQLKTLGSTARDRRALTAAALWHDADDGGIDINDWLEHNGKRDARRAADRERKREARKADKSGGTSAGQSAGRSTLPARVDGSEGSERSKPWPYELRNAPRDQPGKASDESLDDQASHEIIRVQFEETA